MKIRVISIPIEGPITVEEIDAEDLNDYQRLVGGGYVRGARLYAPDAVMWLDEDGKLKGLSYNQRASAIAWQHGYPPGGMPDPLVGDAFIAGVGDSLAAATTVPDFYIEALTGEVK